MHAFFKFGVLSGGGWLLDCALLLLLSQVVGISLPMANFFSSTAAALTVFTISRFFIFEAANARPLLRTLIYFSYTCMVIIVASLAIAPIAKFLQSIATDHLINLSSMHIDFLAKIFITPPQLIANFFASKFLVEYSTSRSKN